MEIQNWVKHQLRELRKQSRLTQGEVSKNLGMSTSAVTGFERQNTDMKLETLFKLLEFYRVHPADFFDKAPFSAAQKPKFELNAESFMDAFKNIKKEIDNKE